MLRCLYHLIFPLIRSSIHMLRCLYPVLNPYAITFVPLYNLYRRNCVIIAILATLLFLIILLLIHLITTNNHGNPNKIIIGHSNINSIRYKFEFLKELTGTNIDIFLISETKLNDTFPSGQFLMNAWLSHTYQI